MEDYQLKIIRDNGPQLMKFTKCSTLFLVHFSRHGVLGDDEIKKILNVGKLEDDTAQAGAFYELIKTRVGSFDVLLKALEETQQTGATELLKANLGAASVSPIKKSPKFARPPKYLENFLSGSKPSEIIVVSPNTMLTCERIFEPLSKICQTNLSTYSNFLDSIYDDDSRDRKNLPVFVVDCGDESFFSHEPGETNAKVVLVVSHYEQDAQATVQYIHEQLMWNELTPHFRRSLVEKVQSITEMPAQTCNKILPTIESSLLFDLVQGSPVPLLGETVPDTVPYYIPRCLVSRDEITTEIFIKNQDDLILVEGIQRHKLTELANADGAHNLTDTSSHLISNFPVKDSKIAVLEYPSHFEKLVNLYKNSKTYNSKSIHFLDYKRNLLKWKQSFGRINLVQQCVKNQQIVITEADLVDEIRQSKIFRTICISDTPGMGKSVLLSHIPVTLAKHDSELRIAFVVLSDLINDIKPKVQNQTLNETVILDSLGKLICDNDLGRKALLYNPDLLHHLFLDAFDEIGGDDIEIGFKCLQVLQGKFKQTNLWVSTRPHILIEMEQKLCILGYNIKAFDEQNQLSFLSNYWSLTYNIEQKCFQRLNDFGRKCTEMLKLHINKDKEDFAGVPLQCLLIAEVFGNKAKEFVETENASDMFTGITQINSLLDLYEKLVDQKIDKFMNRYKVATSKSTVENAHVVYAIDLLFPYCLQNSSEQTVISKLQETILDIFGVGIMEPKRTKYEPKPRFIHRTFAEFFVAKYMITKYCENMLDPVWKSLYKAVLDTTPVTCELPNLRIPSVGFTHNVICYFLDSMLKRVDYKNMVVLPKLKSLPEVSLACAQSNSLNIFRIFVLPKANNNPSKEANVFTKKFVITSAIHAEREFLATGCELYRKSTKKDLFDIKIHELSLLDLSVIRGSYTILEYLLIKQEFGTTLNCSAYCILACKCLHSSCNDSVSVIADKKQILGRLASEILHNSEQLMYLNDLFAKKTKQVHFLLLEEAYQTGLLQLDTVLYYLQADVEGLLLEQLVSLLEFFAAKSKESVNQLCNRVINNSTLVFKIFLRRSIENELLDYMILRSVVPKNLSGSDWKLLIQATIKVNESSRVIRYVTNNSESMNIFNELLPWCVRNKKWHGVLPILFGSIKAQGTDIGVINSFERLDSYKDVLNALRFCVLNHPYALERFDLFLEFLLTITPFPFSIVQELCQKVDLNPEPQYTKVEDILMYLLRKSTVASNKHIYLFICKAYSLPAKDIPFLDQDHGDVECSQPYFHSVFQKLHRDISETDFGVSNNINQKQHTTDHVIGKSMALDIFCELFSLSISYDDWCVVAALLAESMELKVAGMVFKALYDKLKGKRYCRGLSNVLKFCVLNDPNIQKSINMFLDFLLTISPFPFSIVQQLCQIVDLNLEPQHEKVEDILIHLLRKRFVALHKHIYLFICKANSLPAKDIAFLFQDQEDVEESQAYFHLWFQKLNRDIFQMNFETCDAKQHNSVTNKYIIRKSKGIVIFNELLSSSLQYDDWYVAKALLTEGKANSSFRFKIYRKFGVRNYCKEASYVLEFCLRNNSEVFKNIGLFLDYLLTFKPFPVTVAQKLCLSIKEKADKNLSYSVDFVLSYLLRNCSIQEQKNILLLSSDIESLSLNGFTFLDRNPDCFPLLNQWFKAFNDRLLIYDRGYKSICSKNSQFTSSLLENVFSDKVLSNQSKLYYIKFFLQNVSYGNIPLKFCRKNEIRENVSLRSKFVYVICETLLQKLINISEYEKETILLKDMLKYGASVNTEDEDGKTPLHACFINYRLDCVYFLTVLLESGSDPFYSSQEQAPPIIQLYFCCPDTTFEKILSTISLFVHKHKFAVSNFVCAAILNLRIEIVSQVCEWCEFNYPNILITSMKGTYMGMELTPLDAALTSCNGYVLEFIYKKGCNEILAPFIESGRIRRLHYALRESLPKYREILDLVLQENPHIRELAEKFLTTLLSKYGIPQI